MLCTLTLIITSVAGGLRIWTDTRTSHDKSATRNTKTEIYWQTNLFSPHMFHIYCDLDSTQSDYTVCLQRTVK